MTLREQLLAAALAEHSTLSAALAAAREAEAWCGLDPLPTPAPALREPGAATAAGVTATPEPTAADEGEPRPATNGGTRPANGVVANAIVAALQAAAGPLLVREIAGRVGRNTDAVRSILSRLEAAGRVERDLAQWRLPPGAAAATPAEPQPALPPSAAERAILFALRDGSWRSAGQIGETVHRSRAYLYALLQSLRKTGRIEIQGATSSRRFRITAAGLETLAAAEQPSKPTVAVEFDGSADARPEPIKAPAWRAEARTSPPRRQPAVATEDLNAGRLPSDPAPGRPRPSDYGDEEGQRQQRHKAALDVPATRLVTLPRES